MSKPKPPEPYADLKLMVRPELKARLAEYCRLKKVSLNKGANEIIDMALKVRGL